MDEIAACRAGPATIEPLFTSVVHPVRTVLGIGGPLLTAKGHKQWEDGYHGAGIIWDVFVAGAVPATTTLPTEVRGQTHIHMLWLRLRGSQCLLR